MMKRIEESHGKYDEEKDQNRVQEHTGVRDVDPEYVFKAGQSKRIWNELYKVGFLLLLTVFTTSCDLIKKKIPHLCWPKFHLGIESQAIFHVFVSVCMIICGMRE